MKSCENFVQENIVACSEGKAEEQLESKCAKEPSTEDQLTEGQFAEELLAEEFHAAKQCVEMFNAKENDLKESKQSAEEHYMKELSIDNLALDTNDAEELNLNEFDAKPLNVAERIVDNEKDFSDLSCGRIRNCAPDDKSKTGKSTRLGKQPSPNGMIRILSTAFFRFSSVFLYRPTQHINYIRPWIVPILSVSILSLMHAW